MELAIPLTRSVAIGIGVVLLCVIGWAFFMGWMVGAGQNPEAGFARIAGFGKSQEEAPREAPEDEPFQQEGQEGPESQVAEAGEESGMIPEDTGAQQFARPSGEQLSAWGGASGSIPAQKPEVARVAPAKTAPAPPRRQPEKAAPASRFAFTYQVAAFKSKQEADLLAARLKKAGIRASASKSGKVFLVMANLRGTDADARAMVAKLRGMKLGEPLRLARKPLQEGGKK